MENSQEKSVCNVCYRRSGTSFDYGQRKKKVPGTVSKGRKRCQEPFRGFLGLPCGRKVLSSPRRIDFPRLVDSESPYVMISMTGDLLMSKRRKFSREFHES